MGVSHHSPFVTLVDVNSHLTLMAAFQLIHQKVEKSGVQLDSTTGLPTPSSHAVLFLARSLERFEKWLDTLETHKIQPGLRDHELPPLDVLMFLHAYMLNPLDFFEDAVSKHGVLNRIQEFPLLQTVRLIDKATLELIPTVSQVEYWTRVTSLPFDIPFDGPASDTFTITCPRCETGVKILWADLTVSSEATTSQDYPMPEFEIICSTCQLSVSPKALCAGRFLSDIRGSCITGTLLDQTGGSPDLTAAQTASLKVANILCMSPSIPQIAGDEYNWDVGKMIECLSGRLEESSELWCKLEIVAHAYCHPNSFSIDLSKAVLRQARFIFQMSAMGWLEPSRFDDREETLLQAMSQYAQFISIEENGMIARWDIDLIWHTHQLTGARYRNDTLRILGRVLDHDDTQPQEAIMSAAENADAVWKEKFGKSYLVPSYNPDLASSLAKTLCGGASGGACVRGGGDPNNGGKGGGGSGGGGTKRAMAPGEFKNRAVLAH